MRRISSNWAFAVLVLLALSACSRSTPEQVLRLQITQMQHGIEQREAARVIEPLADDFLGNGGMDRQAVERLLLLNQRIEVVLGPVDLSIEGQNAQADFTVVLAGGTGRYARRVAGRRSVLAGRRPAGAEQLRRAGRVCQPR